MKKKKSVLNNAAELILSLEFENFRVRYARALRESLRVDPDHDQPASVLDIHKKFSIDPKTQKKYLIGITRPLAYEFLNDLGRDDSLSSLDKLITQKYQKLFNRPIPRAGKPSLLTYSEVLHIVEFVIDVPLPEELGLILR